MATPTAASGAFPLVDGSICGVVGAAGAGSGAEFVVGSGGLFSDELRSSMDSALQWTRLALAENGTLQTM